MITKGNGEPDRLPEMKFCHTFEWASEFGSLIGLPARLADLSMALDEKAAAEEQERD